MRRISRPAIAASIVALVAPVAASAQTLAVPKPLGNLSLNSALGNGIRIIIGFTGIIAIVAFIYGGFLWMTAGGNSDKTKQAKNTIVWAAIGLLVIFSSYASIRFLLSRIPS